MFRQLARSIVRRWLFLLIVWSAIFGALWVAAPSWSRVAEQGEFAFLPQDAPSRRGEQLFDEAFPDRLTDSSIVLILHRPQSDEGILEEDRVFVRERLEPQLQELDQPLGGSDQTATEQAQQSAERPDESRGGGDDGGEGTAAKSPIAQIRTFADQPVGPLLMSPDDQATLVVIGLTTEMLVERNIDIVAKVERVIRDLRQSGEVPEGLQIEFAGSAVVGRDYQRAQEKSGDAIRSWTIWIVIALLLVVFRAPLLAAVPLITLYVAVEVSLDLLAMLADAGYIRVFEGLQVYTTVLVYGAGVDYSLFLISRYREELPARGGSPAALIAAIVGVGIAIAASAGTEMFGIGTLAFAQFGKFEQAGIAVALGLFIMLCASMTLTPGVLRLMGNAAFWPRHRPSDQHAGSSRFFERFWARVGVSLQQRPATIAAVAVVLMLPFALLAVLRFNDLSYGLIANLPDDAGSVETVDVLQEYFAAGTTGPVTLLIQHEDADFTQQEDIQHVEALVQDLKQNQERLKIADVRSVATPLGITARGQQALPENRTPLVEQVIRSRAVDHYVSQAEPWKGDVTLLEVVLDVDPFQRKAIQHLDQLEEALREALPESLADATLHLTGATASLRDLKRVAEQDRTRIMLMVTGVVLLVLMLVLRRIAIPIFLILTVLFNFLVTFGLTYGVFWLFSSEPFPGLHWTVPIFLFTLLVAVGEDYNIYLVTRVDEEQDREGPVDGVTAALTKTGSIISACGIIMGGTFSSLAVGGTLENMQQLGFSLAAGVLIDTFVVRPILVPAYLVLINNGRLGRSARWLGARPAAAEGRAP